MHPKAATRVKLYAFLLLSPTFESLCFHWSLQTLTQVLKQIITSISKQNGAEREKQNTNN